MEIMRFNFLQVKYKANHQLLIQNETYCLLYIVDEHFNSAMSKPNASMGQTLSFYSKVGHNYSANYFQGAKTAA